MASAGYFYETPEGPYDVSAYWNTLTVTPAEIADATANVRCKAQTNLVGIWWASFAREQQRVIDGHTRYFAAVTVYTNAILARCAEIVAAGKPVGTALPLAPPTMPKDIRASIPD